MKILLSKGGGFGKRLRRISDAELGMMMSAGTAKHLFAAIYTEQVPAEVVEVAQDQTYSTKVLDAESPKRRKIKEVGDGPSTTS
jgi:hypothetical protein